jgi:ssDNA thymidine ADP-ribosyltransferase, DarT
MERSQLVELHYIAPIANLRSILEQGILSHARAAAHDHVSIAAQEIQDRREARRVPGGRRLHEYVNLYVHARNPMMWVRRERHAELCVVRVSPNVLDLPGAIVTSQNASSGYALFQPAPGGLAIVQYELVFARDWRDSDEIVYYRKKSAKCAEVLIPDRVGPEFIQGVYCSGAEGTSSVHAVCEITVTLDPDLFLLEGA